MPAMRALQDLNPFADRTERKWARHPRPAPDPAVVRRLADFKNVGFLEQFMSPAGKLLPRCDMCLMLP